MRLSTRGRYAVMAMVELAARAQGESAECSVAARVPARSQVSLAEIAQAQRLSLAYLEQLFGPLRRAGLVASTRGPGGGYRLSRPAAQISIAAIVEAVDEPIQATRCDEGGPGCLAGDRCLTHDLWAELGSQIRLFLDGVTLADVVCGQVLGRAIPPTPPGPAPAPPA
ncbi:Rrf2 family transcriptional regulator [Falsiroseomonas selenitidurans]|uniref:Rrf2 family transcriptional regulator n=1 Tax=Falsiroseomonas selenitidurans TaxID=2716335 RepID=A0ABX1E4Q0_9PROT|nr:Rrf2 family transcriptional regulator [Falsiroseomonas selenitidurans]NKC31768.1 Rrf2 family transcriptional regulator [Falsiroseomonas selenitidurans]OYW07472.1 MAG: Rrf2 family transcriptional regulator [Rhodospirillales bacterium 12-71-4]